MVLRSALSMRTILHSPGGCEAGTAGGQGRDLGPQGSWVAGLCVAAYTAASVRRAMPILANRAVT